MMHVIQMSAKLLKHLIL